MSDSSAGGRPRFRSSVTWQLVLVVAFAWTTGCRPADDSKSSALDDVASQRELIAAAPGGAISSQPLHAKKSPSGRFVRLSPEETGVDFVSITDTQHPRKYLYQSGFLCGGVAIGDVDGDGRPDIYLVNGPGKNKLFRQTGNWQYEDVTALANVDGGDAWGAGVAMVDIDNDGDLDLYVCNYDAPNLLYVNDGSGKFKESAHRFGLDIVDASLQPAFCDYDRDGDLDLYLLTYRYYYPQGVPADLRDNRGNTLEELKRYSKYFQVIRGYDGKSKVRPVGRPDRLLRNNGDGSFSDVSEAAGIHGTGFGLSATWWDYNGDGWIDLYVANDFNDPDRFYRNNGDGTFTDVCAQVVPHTSNTSMGADVADINNDGLMDFLVADMSATTHFMQKTTMGAMGGGRVEMERLRPPQYMRNALYLNTGTERFMEVAYLTSLAKTDWTWAVKLADLDNDGYNDAFFTNGITRSFGLSDFQAPQRDLMTKSEFEAYEKTPVRSEQNLAFRNRGDLHFEDVSRRWGLDHVGVSAAAAYADLDRDGDLDLVVANLDEPVSLYRNDVAEGRGLLVRLVGVKSNRYGIGATVELRMGEERQIRQMMPGTGYLSGNEPVCHFGLGELEQVEQLTVRWPSGHVQRFGSLAADHIYTITEPDGAAPSSQDEEPLPTRFSRSATLAIVAHRERPYDDFRRQPLLPNQLSRLGPGIAWGDVDGDGDDDLFVGGAAGQNGQLYITESPGTFRRSNTGLWLDDLEHEDMACLLFDVDGDDDLDLFVVSGGVECEPDDELLQDRLYLNDGQGNFSDATSERLPRLRDSGGVAVAADFDRDGDLDLFVGGRVIPGKYPLSPKSRLLRNDGGRFVDATQQVCPRLLETGLVTGALWSDANGDGWLDLLVTHEWGPVKLFVNVPAKDGPGRRLVDRTRQAGLAARLGWWNGITGGDLDGDGDVDYVVTNFGLNTKYHASQEKPALLYYGDFEKKGGFKLVEAEYENETLFPVRGKSCSTRAMPFLADRFKTYRDFALADLPKIYTTQCLESSHRFAATTLQSGVLINDGSGRFEFKPLPRLAQVAPAFGAVITEFDGDGRPDLFLTHNFFSPQWETGRMDGGVSLLLLGRGDGTFTPQRPDQSGLIVTGDAKSATLCDLDGDGRPDLLVGVNNDAYQAFTHQATTADRFLRVLLRGAKGNPTAIGARVTVQRSSGAEQTAEIYAGGGYLSQSPPHLFFGLGKSAHAKEIVVRWPDGTTTTHSPRVDDIDIELSRDP